jgi:uncharacterized C2H2 Zn-finger protein
MRIYCFTCREYVLDTTDKFVMGSDYNGAMFKLAGKCERMKASMFRNRESVKRANLLCPWCEGLFINRGKLLTEFGVIHPGQLALDESFSIIAGPDNPLPGRLLRIEDSKEVKIDRAGEAAKARQALIDSYERCERDSQNEISVEIIEKFGPPESNSEFVECPQCGKQYKNNEMGLRWYNKHVEACK